MRDIDIPLKEQDILYPDSDGQPMADNTLQFEWITTIKGGLETLFAARADVFVAGDLLWYPVQGRPDIRRAPDALVVFGRPKGHRGSYRQWEEAGIAPQVVFEVLSPGNRADEMADKFRFYANYGVEEYYLYDPEDGTLEGWQRRGPSLHPIDPMPGWVSPRLGIRFELSDGELQLFHPNGERFLTYVENDQQRRQERTARQQAEVERDRAEAERDRAEAEWAQAEAERAQERLARMQAEAERAQAEAERAQERLARMQAEAERAQAEAEWAQERLARQQAEQHTAALVARLRELGLDPASLLGNPDPPPTAE